MCIRDREISIALGNRILTDEECGLHVVEIADKSSSTAYHIPEGHLFTYSPGSGVTSIGSTQMPTCDVVPMLLNNYGVKTPGYLNHTSLSI